jgi:hypothetical protein
MEKVITFCGQPMRVACDERCDKAWGINRRPKVQHDPNDRDDYTYVPDGDLGTAPVDPGTYEGDHAKPVNHQGIPNKWCVRECERCYGSHPGRSDEAPKLPDFDRPEANMPKRRMTGNGR